MSYKGRLSLSNAELRMDAECKGTRLAGLRDGQLYKFEVWPNWFLDVVASWGGESDEDNTSIEDGWALHGWGLLEVWQPGGWFPVPAGGTEFTVQIWSRGGDIVADFFAGNDICCVVFSAAELVDFRNPTIMRARASD